MKKPIVLTIDGIDGSGKATITERIIDHIRDSGHSVTSVSFPNYLSPTGQAISEYLGNGYDQSNNRTAAATLYSADRNRYWMNNFWRLFGSGGYDYIVLNRNWMANIFFHTALLTAKATELNAVEQKYKLSYWMPAMTLAEWYHLLKAAGMIMTDRLWSEQYIRDFIDSLPTETSLDGARIGINGGMKRTFDKKLTAYEYLTKVSMTANVEFPNSAAENGFEVKSIEHPLVHENWMGILQAYKMNRINTVCIMMLTMFQSEIMPWFGNEDFEFRTVVLSSSRPSHSQQLFRKNLLKRYNRDASKLDVHEQSGDYLGSVVENVAFIKENLSEILSIDGIFRALLPQSTGLTKYFDYDIINIDTGYDDPTLRPLDDEVAETIEKLRLD